MTSLSTPSVAPTATERTLPPNTPKDTPTGSIQIIYALRLFQKSLVRNMKLVPGYPRWWLILHLKWGRRRGCDREGGWNNTTILAWGIEGNNATLSYEALVVLWVILGCTAVCFHVVCYWQSCARSCERRRYIRNNTRPGGNSNDVYDIYSIPSLLMSWCMFWGMSLE